MRRFAIVLVLFLSTVQYGFASPSILDSGKSAAEIAADILNGAKERYVEEIKEKDRVVMYSTSWCGYCRKAREYFNSKSIGFQEFDIEKDSFAKREYDALNGKGIPLIVVDERVLRGFDRDMFDYFYNKK